MDDLDGYICDMDFMKTHESHELRARSQLAQPRSCWNANTCWKGFHLLGNHCAFLSP